MNILITGGTGMVGKYLKEILTDAVYVGSKDCDLTDYKQVCLLIKHEEPDWIIHLAARVGGILDNQKYPCSYYEENILMNTNIVKAAVAYDVPRLTGVLSTCAYPDVVNAVTGDSFSKSSYSNPYPLKEELLHAGPPAASNFGYGIAKRALAAHIDTCNEQYGTKYNYIIPCNLYGFYDNYHPERSHYVAALIRKIHAATDTLELFGTGKPLRQFMYAGDLAQIIMLMVARDITDSFNVATPEVYSIRRIANIALETIGKDLLLEFNESMPDGQYRKDVSIEKFKSIFPGFNFTPLSEGIKKTYEFYSNGLRR